MPSDSTHRPDRTISYDRGFQDDLRWWVQTDPKLALRVLLLMDETLRTPFAGTGKPEPLRHGGANRWSRRINDEHRLVYLVEHEQIVFIQARYHYKR